jgi:galactose oxidase-like protein
MNRRIIAVVLGVMICVAPALGAARKKPKLTKAPGANLRKPIIWSAECVNPDGFGLAFGGHKQAADDGRPHTRIKKGDKWEVVAELCKATPRREKAWAARNQVKDAAATVRHIFFEGAPADEQAKALAEKVIPDLKKTGDELAALARALQAKLALTDIGCRDAALAARYDAAIARLVAAGKRVTDVAGALEKGASPGAIETLWTAQVALEKAAELLDAEPGARALAPIVWEPKHKVFVLFGGDHLDFLRNDVWLFDPAKRTWELRMPASAPPPRANHKIVAAGDGKIKVSGGFTYYNNIWYMGPPYQLHEDGVWTYDLAKNTWTNGAGAKGVSADSRTYRAKLFHPLTYVKAKKKPDAAATAKTLDALPANTWTVMNPPLKPKMNRDWGSACIDTDRDVMLRWSGGHSAHGGSDVIIYHFATNRWELPYPVEFPLGQMYSNTGYPGGFNFNRRPWVTGHTYKNFGYDPVGKKMQFLGHSAWNYIFDPAKADWVGRLRKPKILSYRNCFYTLTVCTAGKSLYVWGGIYGHATSLNKWDAAKQTWGQLKVTGTKLPCPKVDHCGLSYDAKRDRLILFPKKSGGTLYALNCKTNELSKLKPTGRTDIAKTFSFWRELVYLPDADVILNIGQTAALGGERVTLGYDCAKNTWLALKIGGPNPSSKGRNVGQGAVYDPKRKLVWATSSRSQMWVLRPDIAKAERVGLPAPK